MEKNNLIPTDKKKYKILLYLFLSSLLYCTKSDNEINPNEEKGYNIAQQNTGVANSIQEKNEIGNIQIIEEVNRTDVEENQIINSDRNTTIAENTVMRSGKDSTIGDYLVSTIGSSNKLFTIDPLLAINKHRGNNTIIQDKNLDNPIITSIFKVINNNRFKLSDVDKNKVFVDKGVGSVLLKKVTDQFPHTRHPLLLQYKNSRLSYAYMLIDLEYPKEFSKRNSKFNNEIVEGFGFSADNFMKDQQERNLILKNYVNPNQFIVEIRTKDNKEQLIIAKGYNDKNPDDVLKIISNLSSNENTPCIEDFWMPSIAFKAERKYEGISKNNKEIDVIGAVDFRIDHKGARLEAFTGAIPKGGVSFKPKVKLYCDGPIMIIMKLKSNINNPYFFISINDSTIMKKVTTK